MATATSSSSFSAGKQYSFVLHIVLLLLMIFGLPSFMHRTLEPEPEAISVDILPISPITNVKPQEQTQPQPEKKPVEEKRTAKKALPETRQVQQKVQPPAPADKPEHVSAKDVVKVPEKKVKKEVKKPVDELESVLNSVKETAKAEEAQHPTEQAQTEPNQKEAQSQTYDNNIPLSMSEKDAIRQQMQRCWHMPAGAKDAKNLIVTLRLQIGQDGSVTDVGLSSDQSRYASDSFFRAAADAAIRAVRECSPLQNLPSDKFGSWHDMELTFDPKDAL